MDAAVQAYVDAIPPDHRALFDRVHALVLSVHPDAAVVLSYGMPTYRVDERRLHVGVWRHGVSIYGWRRGHEHGFLERHPGLGSGKGTIRLRPQDAAGVTDDELVDLVRGALDG